MKRVAVLYGFSEGPLKAGALAAALSAHGYQLVAEPLRADIIITHSGGCQMIPPQATATLIVLDAPTVGPATKTPIRTQLRKMARDVRAHGVGTFLARNLPNVVGLLRYPVRNVRMMLRVRAVHGALPECAPRTVVLTHQGDPWSESLPASVMAHAAYTFLCSNSDHDDIWHHPEPYVRLLDYYSK